MRICISQLNPTIGAIEENVKKIIQEIRLAKGKQAELIIFPEMAICGYPPEDLVERPGFIEAVRAGLDAIIFETAGVDLIVGLPRRAENGYDKPLCNSAAV